MTDTREPEGPVIEVPLEPVVPMRGLPDRAGVQQIGQWALVWQRFKRHRLAVIGAWVALFVVLLAIVGPFFAPPLPKPDAYGMLSPATQRLENLPPRWNWPYIFGSDFGAAPVVTNVLTGGSPILLIGVFGALMASILGILIGGVAGYLGSYIDAFLMRLVDAFLAVPFLILLILLARYLPFAPTIPAYILIFGLAGWAGVARLVRSYILSLREREYTVAARALGVSPGGIILRHLLPNALDVLVVSFTLNIAVFMVTDVTLDYLGSGTGIPSWGSGLAALAGPYWWAGAFPGVALLLTVLAVNFLGDGLRDALDTGSTTALVTLRPPVEAGPLRRTLGALGRTVGSAREGARTRAGALEVGRRTTGALGRVVPAGIRAWSADDTRAYRSTPIALAVGPIALAVLVAGTIMLLGHSPLAYAPNYPSPTTVAQAYTEQGYGAWPSTGGWDLFQVDTRRDLVFQRVDATGRVVREQRLAPGDSGTTPAMAENHGQILGAWVADSGQVVRATYLGRGTARPVTLNSPGGTAEHPFVVPMPGGRFDVLFDWQPAGSSADNVYLAAIGAGTTRVRLQQLTNVHTSAIDPHAVLDGSGGLDLAYLQETKPDYGIWHLYFQRFIGAKSLGRRQDLGTINYVKPGPNGCGLPANAPYQWALDMKRVAGGSVWAAWEYGTDCVGPGGVSGANTLAVAHWSPTGGTLLAPTVVSPGVDAAALSVALALQRGGGILYYPTPAQVEPILTGTTFNSQGRALRTVRVAYDAGGRPANPEAGTINGRPAVIWQKVRGGTVTVEGTRYRPAAPPDLLTRLGLNVGALWGNVLLVVFGSLAGGIALTVVNLYLLAPLLVVWLLLRRIASPRIRWPIFLAAIAALLAYIFAAHPSPPWYVLMFGAFGVPYAWVAVAGAVFTSWWSGAFILSRRESGIRAMVMALMGLYFVAVMYAVIFIEGQLGQI